MCGHADALCPSKHLPGQLDRVPLCGEPALNLLGGLFAGPSLQRLLFF